MVDNNNFFDEEFYFLLYPDVQEAVKKGIFSCGYNHYNDFGRKEGRQANFKTEQQFQIDRNYPGIEQHLTLEGYKPQPKKDICLNMVNVPEEFMPNQNNEYPKGNVIPFERYFNNKFIEIKPNTFRTYLPIQWTAYYVNNSATNAPSLRRLQKYIDSLDKGKKYFTIVQYDDGIVNSLFGIDILVYSMGCKKPGYYPLPLISQPLNNKPTEIYQKELLFSFFGENTHAIRKQLVDELKNEWVSFRLLEKDDYYEVLKHSTFALCPRGYGITSFRMFEAMAFGCIPVYISNDFWEPFNIPFTEYGVKIKPDKINVIPEILMQIDIKAMQAKGKEIYEKYFVYSQCANAIIKTLA